MPLIFSLDAGPDAPGRPVPAAAVGDVPIQWSADGRSIYMRRAGDSIDRKTRIFRVDLETGRWELWKEIALAETTGASVGAVVYMTPDGKSYAYAISRNLSQLYLAEGLK
jgi:Tol biopolymer transport system component